MARAKRVAATAQQSQKAHTARLIVVDGEHLGRTFKVEGPVIFGRDPDVDIIFNHPDVSRRHAIIRSLGEGFMIEDFDSRNGTFVDGVRVKRHSSNRERRFDSAAASRSFSLIPTGSRNRSSSDSVSRWSVA